MRKRIANTKGRTYYYPRDKDDFNKKEYYFIYYSCPDNCQQKHSHIERQRYRGQIILLGSKTFLPSFL